MKPRQWRTIVEFEFGDDREIIEKRAEWGDEKAIRRIWIMAGEKPPPTCPQCFVPIMDDEASVTTRDGSATLHRVECYEKWRQHQQYLRRKRKAKDQPPRRA